VLAKIPVRGWVITADDHDCDPLEEFCEAHDVM